MIKVLVVDDEPDLVEMIQYNLEKEGYSVDIAGDGEEAIAKYESFSPDLILLDIMMPKIDGVEVCREIREKPGGSETIIAFLTARNEDFTQIAALDMGGDDFISKPIRPRVLMSRVKALLRRKKNISGSSIDNDPLQLGDILIDREKYTVFIGEKKIDLPKKEFELLYLLASRPGKVFTREEIFDKIWGPDVIVGTRTIDVHIRKLREKCGEKYIRTVKGIGYKMEF